MIGPDGQRYRNPSINLLAEELGLATDGLSASEGEAGLAALLLAAIDGWGFPPVDSDASGAAVD